MKNVTRFFFLGLFATFVLQFPPAIVHADICALCEDRPHLCSPETLAACKNPCSKEDQEKIKGLIGRLRALKEVADLTRKEYNEAVKARDKERDGIWGGSGSVAVYVNSLVGMASISPAAPSWIGWANTGIDVLQSPGDWSTWAGAGSQVVGDDYVITRASEIIIKEGTERAEKYLAATGDFVGASKIYDQALSGRIPDTPLTPGQLKTGAQVVGAVLSVQGCVNATEDLTSDVSNYFEARREANQLQKQLDRIDQQIEDILKELEELRRRCASKEGTGTESPGSSSGNGESTRSLSGGDTASPFGGEDRPNEAVLQKLFYFQARLDRIEVQFRNRLLVPLSPFMLKTVWKEMDRKLLLEISRSAFPVLKTWSKEIEEAVTLGREIERDLKF